MSDINKKLITALPGAENPNIEYTYTGERIKIVNAISKLSIEVYLDNGKIAACAVKKNIRKIFKPAEESLLEYLSNLNIEISPEKEAFMINYLEKNKTSTFIAGRTYTTYNKKSVEITHDGGDITCTIVLVNGVLNATLIDGQDEEHDKAPNQSLQHFLQPFDIWINQAKEDRIFDHLIKHNPLKSEWKVAVLKEVSISPEILRMLLKSSSLTSTTNEEISINFSKSLTDTHLTEIIKYFSSYGIKLLSRLEVNWYEHPDFTSRKVSVICKLKNGLLVEIVDYVEHTNKLLDQRGNEYPTNIEPYRPDDGQVEDSQRFVNNMFIPTEKQNDS